MQGRVDTVKHGGVSSQRTATTTTIFLRVSWSIDARNGRPGCCFSHFTIQMTHNREWFDQIQLWKDTSCVLLTPRSVTYFLSLPPSSLSPRSVLYFIFEKQYEHLLLKKIILTVSPAFESKFDVHLVLPRFINSCGKMCCKLCPVHTSVHMLLSSFSSCCMWFAVVVVFHSYR